MKVGGKAMAKLTIRSLDAQFKYDVDDNYSIRLSP